MNRRLALAVLAAATVSLSTAVTAGEYKAGSVMVKEPWARVTLQNLPAGGYFMVHNMGDKADRLVTVESELAERAELHTHTMNDGVMQMRRVDGIDLPAKSQTQLKPGGYHVMLFGLKELVAKGGKIPLVLKFENAGELAIELTVGAKPMGHGHGSMDHKHGSSN